MELEKIKASNPLPIDLHKSCRDVIQSQMKLISSQKERIDKLNQQVELLRDEVCSLKNGPIRGLKRMVHWHQSQSKRKSDEISQMKSQIKRIKLDPELPAPPTEADGMLLELIKRRNVCQTEPYSQELREFSFKVNYASPRAYSVTRKLLPGILPHPNSFNYWTHHVKIAPGTTISSKLMSVCKQKFDIDPPFSGILPLAVQDIQLKCSNTDKKMYYSLAFDEMSIREQVIFNGEKMIGKVDYGGLVQEPENQMAKSALFCLVTEINGSKSFPLMYLLTNGVKADVLATAMKACISTVNNSNGTVLSISFDGLPANLSAVKKLGACLDPDKGINPQIEFPDAQDPNKIHSCNIMPDACHMLKLVRNNWKTRSVFFNGEKKVCKLCTWTKCY